jgi:hypothetical protein
MNNLHLLGDIDIDTHDRSRLLQPLNHVPASASRNGQTVKHNTGVYFHAVPQDPFSKWCSLSYEQAEQQGCYKIDLLNNHIYSGVQSEAHLNHLMQTQPMWELLQHEEFVKELAHINNHVALVQQLKPRSVSELAMVLALIRPGKRHLVTKCAQQGWHSIESEVWTQDNQAYTFKKAHAISLAVAIVVQMNLLVEQLVR